MDDDIQETEITELPGMETDESNIKHECEPCSNSGKPGIPALYYCKDCTEKYCEVCTTSHKTQKATKCHDIIDVKLSEFINPPKHCDPCQYKQRMFEAKFACKECEEFLCCECKTAHLSQRRNKNHNMLPIGEELFCEPCKESDKKVPAAGFCEDCEEPELLCVVCADQHKAMKMTRNHNIMFDTATFVLRNPHDRKGSGEEGDSDVSIEVPRCEPCKFKGKDTAAVKFCKECTELMCTTCTTKHLSMKFSANHILEEIQNMLKTVTQVMMCEPCKYNKKERDATHKCEECDEYLCQICKDAHLVPKKNRFIRQFT